MATPFIPQNRRPPLTFAALGLLALACSAPLEGDEVDGPPEFMGTPNIGVPGQAPPQTSNPANPSAPSNTANPSAPGVTPTPNAPPSNGAAGSAGGEPVGSAPVGLDPSTGAPPSSGAGGSSMTGGESSGAGGSSFEPTDPGAGDGDPPTDGDPSGDPPPQPIPGSPSNPPPAQPGPPNAGCNDQFLCDGFENAAPGASPDAALWRIIANYSPAQQSANVQISGANARSGAQALRVLPQGRTGIIADLPAQTYFMRAWIQADAVPRGPVFIGLGTDQNSEMRLRIFEGSSATINSFANGGDGIRPSAATSGNCPECVTLVANRWFCAEFFVDNATRSATLWIDGVEAASVVNGDGGFAAQPATPQMFLGTMDLQGGSTAVWIDDVAAGPQRIGCD